MISLKKSLNLFLIISLFILFKTDIIFAEVLPNSEINSECYSNELMHINKTYKINNKNRLGYDHTLFISYKKSGEKVVLPGVIIKNNKNMIIGTEFKNNKETFFFPIKTGNRIKYNNKDTLFHEEECFSFYTSYDNVIESGMEVGAISFGRKVKKGLFSDNASFKPSFNCDNETTLIGKAICNDNEVSFLDKYFNETINCLKSTATRNNLGNTVNPIIDSLAKDFMTYRDKMFVTKGETFNKNEISNIKKAYMLGIMFIPMTIAATDGDLFLLGKKLFLSYYMLESQGIKYSSAPKKGLSQEDLMKDFFNGHYDEILYHYSAVYDNFNSRLPNLFYYTYYLMEKYGLINRFGVFYCGKSPLDLEN